MQSAKSSKQAVDTDTWLTCAQASDLLGRSENTIRKWARSNVLHPARATRVQPSGASREVEVFDPHELAKIGSRSRIASVPNDPGELAARAFELFDDGKALREVVVILRETPWKISELHEQWADLGGAKLVINQAAQVELQRFLGPFEDVADLVSRVRGQLGAVIEVECTEATPLDRATDSEVERGIVGVLSLATAESAGAGAS